MLDSLFATRKWRNTQTAARVVAALWIAAVIVVSVQAAVQENDVFQVFRYSWFNLVDGRDLYTGGPGDLDYYKYSPTFALLFAPFAVVPFGAGVLLWNAVNAGALYWGLGRILPPEQALAARAIVFMDAVGAMQNVQSNVLVAGLIVIAFAEMERRQEFRAALAIALGTLVKIFPIIAAVFAIFRPWRLPRFALYSAGVAVAVLAAPLVLLSPDELTNQYRSWVAISRTDALTRGFSVMEQLHLWLGVDWPNWPVQLAGAVILLAPLVRLSCWGLPRFRLLYLASVLMFTVLFNHKAESPTFVVALAGVALWFVVSSRTRLTWAVFLLVLVGTVLSASEAMPEVLQERFFAPYRFKTIPVLVVWLITQAQLWSRSVSAPLPSTEAVRAAPAT